MKGNHQSDRVFHAVIYARYSSELQKDSSIDDQIAACSERLAALGWPLIDTYSDRAMTGTSMRGRLGLLNLMEEVENGPQFDVVVVESLDRLSRRASEMAMIFETLEESEIELYSLQDGWINDVTVAIRGLESSSFIKKLKINISRSHHGAVKNRGSIMGLAYGYDVERSNEKPAGGRKINQFEANVVRRIFSNYENGVSPTAICNALNNEGIPSPQGKIWFASSLIGESDKKLGILRNLIYKGISTYGKSVLKKDKGRLTPRRKGRPENEWVKADEVREDLRIVSDDQFDAVQLLIEQNSHKHSKHLVGSRRPKYLLSGLVRCGLCGHNMHVVNGSYTCSFRIGGLCENKRRANVAVVHEFVSHSLIDQLSRPEITDNFISAHNEEFLARNNAAKEELVRDSLRMRELEEAEASLLDMKTLTAASPETKRRLVTQLNDVLAEAAVIKSRMSLREGEKAVAMQSSEMSSSLKTTPLEWHRYIDQQTPEASGARQALRGLITSVTLTPLDNHMSTKASAFRVDVEGPLAALMTASSGVATETSYGRRSLTVRYFGSGAYKIGPLHLVSTAPSQRLLQGWGAKLG